MRIHVGLCDSISWVLDNSQCLEFPKICFSFSKFLPSACKSWPSELLAVQMTNIYIHLAMLVDCWHLNYVCSSKTTSSTTDKLEDSKRSNIFNLLIQGDYYCTFERQVHGDTSRIFHDEDFRAFLSSLCAALSE